LRNWPKARSPAESAWLDPGGGSAHGSASPSEPAVTRRDQPGSGNGMAVVATMRTALDYGAQRARPKRRYGQLFGASARPVDGRDLNPRPHATRVPSGGGDASLVGTDWRYRPAGAATTTGGWLLQTPAGSGTGRWSPSPIGSNIRRGRMEWSLMIRQPHRHRPAHSRQCPTSYRHRPTGYSRQVAAAEPKRCGCRSPALGCLNRRDHHRRSGSSW